MSITNISSQEFKKMIIEEPENLEIIDVRENDEYELIKIKGSKLIPVNQIVTRLNEIDWKKKVVVVCRSGSRSAYVATHLAAIGQEVINLRGGIHELYLNNFDCLEKSPECCQEYF